MTNERIQELAIQARKNSARWGVYMEEEFYEKFAELIVGQCIAILADNGEFRSCVIIRKHFGVEE